MYVLGATLKNIHASTNPKATIKIVRKSCTHWAPISETTWLEKTHNVCISLTYLKVLLTTGESLLEWWPSSPEFSIQTSSELNVRSLECLKGMYLNIYPKHITDITEMLKMSKPINGGCQLLKQSEISPSLFHSNIVWK